jgi:hypothetical protein
MKQTDEDKFFAYRFAQALEPHVERERREGKTLSKIASTLGVTAAGLQKQLTGGTPSIRTVALAFARYRVAVPYIDVDIARVISSKRRKKGDKSDEQQLTLPFEIKAPSRPRRLGLKLVSTSPRRYRLQLTIGV